MERSYSAESLIEKFGDIVFDEALHRYTLNGKTAPSVSSVIKKFYKEFDGSKAPSYLRKQWKEKGDKAAAAGTRVHEFAENYIEYCGKPRNNKELGVVQFLMDVNPEVLQTEQRLYHYDLNYFGTADLLLKVDGKIILADWKTNETLHKDYGDSLYEPFGEYINNAHNRYMLQLGHYELALEQVIDIDERWLIHLTEDGNKYYKVYPVPDVTETLKQYYDDRTRRNIDNQVADQQDQ
jgi:ATP-dependent exoDNAse (exonuclease V) beta subunit